MADISFSTAVVDAPPSNDLLAAALAYAAKGWRVIHVHTPKTGGGCSCRNPDCKHPGKHPRINRWPEQATTDPEMITRIWSCWPDANVGLVFGDGHIDIECDPRHGGDESIVQLEQRLGGLPDTVTWISGRGGEHRLFRVPSEARIPSTANIGKDLLGVPPNGVTGVDVRATGGFAVAPPSLHENGNLYRFGNLHPEAIEVADLPAAWLEYLNRPSRVTASLGAGLQDASPIPDGARNSTLTKIAGLLRRGGLSESEMLPSLVAINGGRCKPPLDPHEVATIARSVARYEPNQGTVAVIENWAETTLGIPGQRSLAFQWFKDTVERKPDWLWRGYLLRGATAVVGGRQGTSKGLFTIDIAARLSRGDTMPDGSGGGTPTQVLIVTREDDPSMALLARLRMAGADMSRIAWSTGDFSDHMPIPTMAAAAEHIATVVREQHIGLVIIDPLGAWVEDDANNGQQIRAVIDPMNRVAAQTGCAVLFVAHLRKAQADDPMDAFAGSVQVTAACRTAILITPTNDGAERLVRVVKTNFRRPDGTLIYLLDCPSTDPDDPPRLVWRAATGEDLAIAATAARGTAPIVPLASVLDLLPDEHRPLKETARAIRKALLPAHRGITVQGVLDALAEAISTGQAHEGADRHGARTVGRLPAAPPERASDRAIAYWEAHPQAKVREVATAASCSVGLANNTKKKARCQDVHSVDGDSTAVNNED